MGRTIGSVVLSMAVMFSSVLVAIVVAIIVTRQTDPGKGGQPATGA